MAFLVRSNQWGYYGILLNNEEFSVFPFEFNGLVCEEPRKHTNEEKVLMKEVEAWVQEYENNLKKV